MNVRGAVHGFDLVRSLPVTRATGASRDFPWLLDEDDGTTASSVPSVYRPAILSLGLPETFASPPRLTIVGSAPSEISPSDVLFFSHSGRFFESIETVLIDNLALPRNALRRSGPRQAGPSETPAHKIAEAKLLSGLTWEELARAMNSSRRSLHFWANGRTISAVNEERLSRLLAALRAIDRGTGAATRTTIMGPDDAGRVPFDLILGGRFDEFRKAVGPGRGRPRKPSMPLSPGAIAERMPSPVAVLVDNREDPIRIEPAPLVRDKSLHGLKRGS